MPSLLKAEFQTEEELKRAILVAEAHRWLGFTEQGGDNKGEIIQMFQKAVDGKATGEPWCMALDQFCINNVDDICDAILGKHTKSVIYKSEHCMITWNNTSRDQHSSKPGVGTLMIWRYGSTSAGHVGIVVAFDKDPNYVWTIEGNTGPQERVNRDGDGVYLKKRSIHDAGNMNVVGWLYPWTKEE